MLDEQSTAAEVPQKCDLILQLNQAAVDAEVELAREIERIEHRAPSCALARTIWGILAESRNPRSHIPHFRVDSACI